MFLWWGVRFLSTLSLRRATTTIITICTALRFLSTLSLRRATYWSGVPVVGRSISIHALLAESDKYHRADRVRVCISIHALLAESDVTVLGIQHRTGISIHALLAESDARILLNLTFHQNFYPRSPCGERLNEITYQRQIDQFLSTLSLRRATLKPPVQAHREKHFYPRSPCGERPHPIGVPVRIVEISIHALLAESDTVLLTQPTRKPDFYPRSPCGERHADIKSTSFHKLFLSTLSLRRATGSRIYDMSAA